jgi:hypothetical protein
MSQQQDKSDRPKIEFDVETLEHEEIILAISTAKTSYPRVTFSLARRPRDSGNRPSTYLPWEMLDSAIAALQALKANTRISEHAAAMAVVREKSDRQRQQRMGGGGGGGNRTDFQSGAGGKSARRSARRQRPWDDGGPQRDTSHSERARRQNAAALEEMQARMEKGTADQ